MNPAVLAATTATNAALANAAARRSRVLKRIQELGASRATRERVLEGEPELAPVLDALLREGVVRARPDGTLRHDVERMRGQQRRTAKVALLVLVVVLAVAAGTLLSVYVATR